MFKVQTNRKATKGRKVYYQVIMLKHTKGSDKGKPILDKLGRPKTKTIKHIQETPSALRRKLTYNEILDNISARARKYDKTGRR